MNGPNNRVNRGPDGPPEQGRRRECERRLRQIRDGRLAGAAVSDEARYAAHGFVAPSGAALIRTASAAEQMAAEAGRLR